MTQEQQVEHYLALWRTYPTKDNWARVVDSADAYRGRYYTFNRPGPERQNRRALGRLHHVGARGCEYHQVFRKGSRTWTRPR